jgi:hypothetical protein
MLPNPQQPLTKPPILRSSSPDGKGATAVVFPIKTTLQISDAHPAREKWRSSITPVCKREPKVKLDDRIRYARLTKEKVCLQTPDAVVYMYVV